MIAAERKREIDPTQQMLGHRLELRMTGMPVTVVLALNVGISIR